MTTAPKIISANPPPTQPIAYGYSGAAQAVGVGPTKLRNEIRAKRLRARKIGRRTIITREDLENWAARLPDTHDVAAAPVAKHRVAGAEVTEI